MQNLIVSGKLPSTKDECATLAALHLRVYELNYMRLLEEEEEKQQMKMNMAAKKSKDTTTSSIKMRNNNNKDNNNGGEISVRMDVSHDETSNNNQKTTSNNNNVIEEEDDEAAAAAAVDSGQVAITTKTTKTTKTTTTQIEVIAASTTKSKDEVDGAIERSMKEGVRDSVVSIQSANLMLATNGCESMFIYLKSCSCFSHHAASRILSLKQLVSPNYQRSNDIMKLIKVVIDVDLS